MNVIGKIEIILTDDMQVRAKIEVPGRQFFNMMMETAKQNGLTSLMQAESRKIVLPEPDVGRLAN